MASKKSENAVNLVIPPLELEFFSIKIVGDTPLIMHNWSEKAKREILYKQTGAATKGKEKRKPFVEYCNSLYWLDKNDALDESINWEPMTEDEAKAKYEEVLPTSKFGFPATAFKAAAIAGGYRSGILPDMVKAKGSFHILGEFVEIEAIPKIREDMVRIKTSTVPCYRGEFYPWSTTLTIKYNKNGFLSPSQIVNLFNVGGFAVGIGEWRTEKGGSYGAFHVESSNN